MACSFWDGRIGLLRERNVVESGNDVETRKFWVR